MRSALLRDRASSSLPATELELVGEKGWRSTFFPRLSLALTGQPFPSSSQSGWSVSDQWREPFDAAAKVRSCFFTGAACAASPDLWEESSKQNLTQSWWWFLFKWKEPPEIFKRSSSLFFYIFLAQEKDSLMQQLIKMRWKFYCWSVKLGKIFTIPFIRAIYI